MKSHGRCTVVFEQRGSKIWANDADMGEVHISPPICCRLKGAETGDWMASRPALSRAIITTELSIPGLVDVLANNVGVWPLVVSYLKETGRKDNGDSLAVKSSLFGLSDLRLCSVAIAVLLFRRRGWTGICDRVSFPG